MTASIYLIPATAIVLLIWHCVIAPVFVSPLKKIPAANASAHISRLWILWIRWRNVENRTILDLHQRLGPIVRLAPNELSVNCYEGGLKTIYGGGFAKDDFYVHRFVNYGTPNMLCITGNKEHGARRKMVSQIYSKSSIMNSASLRVTSRNILFERLLPMLAKSADEGQPIDAVRLSFSVSMDSFMAFQLGLKLGSNFLQNVEERDWYIDAFFARRSWYFWNDQFPSLIGFLNRLGIHFVPKRINDSTEELAQWNLQKCDQAEEELAKETEYALGDEPGPFAQERSALRKAGSQNENSTSKEYPYRKELASEMFDHNAAAMETSGDTLSFLFYELSCQPELQSRLREELLKLDPPITFPAPGPDSDLPDFKAVDSIELLDAILYETLRRWPAVPGGQPRITPPAGCNLAGYDIPPNVKVMSSANVLHRNPDVFPDPEKWNPYRWLDASKEQLNEMNRWFWAFSSGSRTCIGNNFALNSMKLTVAAIYSNFTTSIVGEGEIEQGEGFTAGPAGKLMVQFHRIN